MSRFRPFLGVILVVIATFVIGCGGPPQETPKIYTPEVLKQVQIYTPSVTALRQRFPELEEYIQEKDWVDVQSFIHGPMGELRARVNRLAATLLPRDQEQAEALASELYIHLERLDNAAQENNQVIAGQEYRAALDSFDAFLDLVPTVD